MLTGKVEVKGKVGVVQMARLGNKIPARDPAVISISRTELDIDTSCSIASCPKRKSACGSPEKECYTCSNGVDNVMYHCSKKIGATCGRRGHWEASPALFAVADANNVLPTVRLSALETGGFPDDENGRGPRNQMRRHGSWIVERLPT